MGQGASPFTHTPVQLTPCCPAQAACRWSHSPYETGLVLVCILPREVPESQGDISNRALRLLHQPIHDLQAPPDPLTPTLFLHGPWHEWAATSFLCLSLQGWDWRMVRIVFSPQPEGLGDWGKRRPNSEVWVRTEAPSPGGRIPPSLTERSVWSAGVLGSPTLNSSWES